MLSDWGEKISGLAHNLDVIFSKIPLIAQFLHTYVAICIMLDFVLCMCISRSSRLLPNFVCSAKTLHKFKFNEQR